MNRVLLLTLAGLFGGCGSDPPPPPPNHKIACDTLDYCRISTSGFSCDGDRASSCGQCINGTPCGAILSGACVRDCPGVTFKPK